MNKDSYIVDKNLNGSKPLVPGLEFPGLLLYDTLILSREWYIRKVDEKSAQEAR